MTENAFRANNKAAKKKLGYGQVQDIRTLYAAGSTQGALAREYQVSVVQIGRIVRGEAWQDARQAVITPTAADHTEMLNRVLKIQQEMKAAPIEPIEQPRNELITPAIQSKAAEMLGRTVPLSPLDGAEPTDEAPIGLAKLVQALHDPKVE